MSILPSKSLSRQEFSPWQAQQSDQDKHQLQQFCHQILPKISFNYSNKNKKENCKQLAQQISINKIRIRRPNTNVMSQKDSRRDIIERHRNILTRVSSKVQRQISKPIKQPNNQNTKQLITGCKPLQQISIKNFITQGSRQTNRDLLGHIRKKQSSYIMKQKFIQIKRSMNLQLGIWGSINKNYRRIQTANSSSNNNNIYSHPNTINPDSQMQMQKQKQNKFILRLRRY